MRGRIARRIAATLASLGIALVASLPLHAASDAGEIDRLVRDACTKSVVMLGEDAHHASGATVAVKARVVSALVDRCGFDVVAFESGFYDFVAFARAIRRGDATRAQLADAIGGLWSTSAEMQPLIDALHAKARMGAIRVVGIDPQPAGATSRYAQRQMPDDLAAYLDRNRRDTCRTEIDRLTNWRYDDVKTFYDDATRMRLRDCAREIDRSAMARIGDPDATDDARMAFELARSLDLSGPDAFQRRDAAMSENIDWYRSTLKRSDKIIVWCATVHAAKSPMPTHPQWISLGAHLRDALGADVASFAFTAISGRYGRAGEPATRLVDPPPASIEHEIGPLDPSSLRYVDHAVLAALGDKTARAFDYTRFDTLDWANAIDGLVVLGEERPLHAASVR